MKRCVGASDNLCANLTYDPGGDLEHFTNRNGQTTSYDYDELNRVRFKQVHAGLPASQ